LPCVYVQRKAKNKTCKTSPVAIISLLEEEDIFVHERAEYDVWGVKVGICEHKFHGDNSFKRAVGV
jgi:hypothetical protein